MEKCPKCAGEMIDGVCSKCGYDEEAGDEDEME